MYRKNELWYMEKSVFHHLVKRSLSATRKGNQKSKKTKLKTLMILKVVESRWLSGDWQKIALPVMMAESERNARRVPLGLEGKYSNAWTGSGTPKFKLTMRGSKIDTLQSLAILQISLLLPPHIRQHWFENPVDFKNPVEIQVFPLSG